MKYWILGGIVGWVREIKTWFFDPRTNDGTFMSFGEKSGYKRYVDEHGENWNKSMAKSVV